MPNRFLDFLPEDEYARVMQRPVYRPRVSRAPAHLAPLFEEVANRYGLDPDLLERMAQQESGFNPSAQSPAGAQGIMQLMPSTAQGLGVQDPWDAAQNLDGGARYLKQMLDRYGGDQTLALMAYNSGPGTVDRYGANVPYEETQRYVRNILGGQQAPPPMPEAQPFDVAPPGYMPELPSSSYTPGPLPQAPVYAPPPEEEPVQYPPFEFFGYPVGPRQPPRVPSLQDAWQAMQGYGFEEPTPEAPLGSIPGMGPIQGPMQPTEGPIWTPPTPEPVSIPGLGGVPFDTSGPLLPGAPSQRQALPTISPEAMQWVEEERNAWPPPPPPRRRPEDIARDQIRAEYPPLHENMLRGLMAAEEAEKVRALGGPTPLEQMGAADTAWRGFLASLASPEARQAMQTEGLAGPERAWEEWQPLPTVGGVNLSDVAKLGIEMANPLYLLGGEGLPYQGTAKALTGLARRGAPAVRAGVQSLGPDVLRGMERLKVMRSLIQTPEDEARFAALTERYAQVQEGLETAHERYQNAAMAVEWGTADTGIVRPANKFAGWTDQEVLDFAQREGRNPYQPDWADSLDPVALKDARTSRRGGSKAKEAAAGRGEMQDAQAEMDALTAQQKALEQEMDALMGPPAEPSALTFGTQTEAVATPKPEQSALFAPGEAPVAFPQTGKAGGTADILGMPQFPDEAARLRWERERQIAAGQQELVPPPESTIQTSSPPSPAAGPAGAVPPVPAAGTGGAGGVPPKGPPKALYAGQLPEGTPPPEGPIRMEGEIIDTGLARRRPTVTPPPVDDYQRLVDSLTPDERGVWDRLTGAGNAVMREMYDRNWDALGLDERARKALGDAAAQSTSAGRTHELMQIVPGAQAAGEERVRLAALKALKPVAKDVDALEQYMVAMRGKDLRARNAQAVLPGNVQDPDKAIAAIKKKVGPKRFAALEKAAGLLWQNQDTNVLAVLRNEGFLTDAAYAAARGKNPHYIPFNRADYAVTDAFERQFSRPEASVGSHFVERISEEGSTRKLDQPLSRALAQYIQTTNLVARNRAARSLHESLDAAAPGLARVLKTGDDARPGEGVFAYFTEGRKVRVAAPETFAAMAKGLDAQQANVLSSAARMLTAPLRHGAVTYNPSFILTNPIRDAIGAFVREGLVPLSPAYIKGVVAAFTRNTVFTDAAEAGVLMSGIVSSMHSTDAVKLAASRIGGITLRRPSDLVLAVPRLIERLNMAMEQAPRIATYHKLRGQGVDALEAAVRARDVTVDFAKGGNTMRLINQLIPFSNAGVQGGANVLRTMKDPKRALLYASPLVGLSALAYFNNARFETASQIPDYEWANNWVFILGEGTRNADPRHPERPPEKFPIRVTLPKGPTGALVTLPGEIALRVAWAKGDRSALEMLTTGLGQMAQAASPVGTDATSLTPPGVSTVISLAANRDFFRGRDIVPESEESRPPEMRYGEETPATAVALEQGLSAAAQALGRQYHVSPRMIDFAIKDTTGGAGTATEWLSDLLLGALGYDPTVPGEAKTRDLTPIEKASTVPVVGRFVKTLGNQERATQRDDFNATVEEGQRLVMTNPEARRLGISVGPVAETIKRGGQDMALPPVQRIALQRTADQLKRVAVDSLVGQSYYQQMDDQGKAAALSAVMERAGAIAKNTLGDKPRPVEALETDAAEFPVAYGLKAEYDAIPSKRGMTAEEDKAARAIDAYYRDVARQANGNTARAAQMTKERFGAGAIATRNRWLTRGSNKDARERFWRQNRGLLDKYFNGQAGADLAEMRRAQ